MNNSKYRAGILVYRAIKAEKRRDCRLDKKIKKEGSRYPEPTKILPNGCRVWVF